MSHQKKIAGAILAGGKATRLNGIAKGNIKINQQTIIERSIGEFNKTRINDIVISANDPKPYKQYNLPIISDNAKNIGPVSGIIAVLNYLQEYDTVIFMPCDLPNITHKEISRLKINKLAYAVTEERAHPLCAAIPTDQLHNIINNDERKIINIWQQLNATPINFDDENKFYNINAKALIWVISGAGRGVGKTTLANNLCSVLPYSIYAKYGHGKFNPQKQKNFFNDLDTIYAFINQHLYIKQNIVIEANKVALAGKGDITIFIDAIPNKTKPRKDANELKTISALKIDSKTTLEACRKILKEYPIANKLHQVLITFFINQQRFIS